MARMFASREAAAVHSEAKGPWGARSRRWAEEFPRESQNDRWGTRSADIADQAELPRFPAALFAPNLAPIQRKATVSVPNEPLEKAADEGAEKLLRMEEPDLVNGASGTILRKCASCEDEDENKIHAKREVGAGIAAMDTTTAIRAAERPGEPLPQQTREFFEPRIGFGLGHVQVHADAEAARAAASVQAKAYACRDRIVFGAGEYAPNTHAGQKLIAHEVMHVGQRMRGASQVIARYADTPPLGSVYWGLPAPLRLTLARSFEDRIAGIVGAERNLDNAFWAGEMPANASTWDALDRIDVGGLNTLVKVYEYMSHSGVPWGLVRWVKNIWLGTSDARAESATREFLTAVAQARDADACAWVWYADVNASRCADAVGMVRRSGLDASHMKSTSTYGHGAGAVITMDGPKAQSFEVNLICSVNSKTHQGGAGCRWYVVDLVQIRRP